MEEQKFSISDSFEKSKEYLETQLQLLKLKGISRMSRILGSLIVDASKVLLSLMIVFFVSLALGFYLGELLGSYSLGFLATGGIFLLLLLIIRAVEPQLEAKFMNLTIKRILTKWDDDEEEAEREAVKEEIKEEIKQEESAEYDREQSK